MKTLVFLFAVIMVTLGMSPVALAAENYQGAIVSVSPDGTTTVMFASPDGSRPTPVNGSKFSTGITIVGDPGSAVAFVYLKGTATQVFQDDTHQTFVIPDAVWGSAKHGTLIHVGDLEILSRPMGVAKTKKAK